MTSLRSLIWAFFLGWATSTAADPARVQSGEHDGFTRFVAPLGSVKDWSVVHTGNKVVLQFDGFQDGFETENVFARIGKDRVTSIDSADNQLTFELDCECRVSAFIDQGRFVVLDIASPDVRLPTPLIEQTAVEIAQEPDDAPETVVAEAIAEPLMPEPPLILPVVPRLVLPAPAAPVRTLDRAALAPEEQVILSDLQQKLAEELGNATTRGVLQAAPDPRRVRRPVGQPPLDTSAFEEVTPAAPLLPETPSDRQTNIRISTSSDMPFNRGREGADVSLSGAVCPAPSEVEIASWGDDRPFDEQMREARAGLFGEFDKLDKKVALRLARSYLHFGFGLEARRTLELDPELVTKHAILIGIADIMDGKTLPDDTYLTRFADCNSDAALWGILALSSKPRAKQPDTDAALRALDKLPIHLRQFLTPALSRRLLELGDRTAANLALRNLERLHTPLPSSAKLAKAEVALDGGETERAKTQLEDVVDDSNENSPEALIRLVDTQTASGQPISIEVTHLVEAYAQELRGTPLGKEMRRAHTQALVKSRQFDRAFAETTAFGAQANRQSFLDLRIFMLRELTGAADDVTFLEHVFDRTDQDVAELPSDDLLALGGRLLELGFATKADDVISLLPERPRNEERQLLLARSALTGEKPFRAQAALIGITSTEADMLRAEANRMTGAHEKAHGYYVQAEQPAAAAEVAWLSEDWRSLTDSETPVFGPASTLQAPEATPATSTDGMLARTESVLDESAATRATLSELLGAIPTGVSLEN